MRPGVWSEDGLRMKRVGNLFEGMVSFPSLLGAFRRAFRGSGKTKEACRFAFHLESELLSLQAELRELRYQPRPYRYFTVYEPKERIISVAAFRDRVVHHALVGVLEPVYERSFIHHSYATRKNKGTHRAIARAQNLLRRHRFYLKMDVQKYFDSIDHAILLSRVTRKIKDERILDLLSVIITNHAISRGDSCGKGLPIGNLTSQFFANVYLDGFDHFVEQQLPCTGYVRYMDDLVFFADDLAVLRALRQQVEGYLSNHLALTAKASATMIHAGMHGLPFLGMRIFPAMKRVKSENVRRLDKKARNRIRAWESGLIDERSLTQSLTSIYGYLAGAGTYCLRHVMFETDDLHTGSNRVNRGGSWNNNADNVRAANRNNNTPGNRNNNLGFRLSSTFPNRPVVFKDAIGKGHVPEILRAPGQN